MNEVRIIGGKWKRRKLAFPDRPLLRPSPDRARVTLFNWLTPRIEGSRCLDLFAGSGALGFEALSRGARSATLVDSDPAVIRALSANQAKLGADACEIVRAPALDFLRRRADVWDLVFLDPPFASDLIRSCLEELTGGHHLAAGSIVYVESSVDGAADYPGWRTIRSSRTGAVCSRLIEPCV